MTAEINFRPVASAHYAKKGHVDILDTGGPRSRHFLTYYDASGEFVKLYSRTHAPCDLLKMTVMLQVYHLANLGHFTEQPESFLGPEISKVSMVSSAI